MIFGSSGFLIVAPCQMTMLNYRSSKKEAAYERRDAQASQSLRCVAVTDAEAEAEMLSAFAAGLSEGSIKEEPNC